MLRSVSTVCSLSSSGLPLTAWRKTVDPSFVTARGSHLNSRRVSSARAESHLAAMSNGIKLSLVFYNALEAM